MVDLSLVLYDDAIFVFYQVIGLFHLDGVGVERSPQGLLLFLQGGELLVKGVDQGLGELQVLDEFSIGVLNGLDLLPE